jgi:hypothetical protein
MWYIIFILMLIVAARLTWVYTNNDRGKVKLIKIKDKTYLCKEFKGFFGKRILWLNPRKSLFSTINKTLQYVEYTFREFKENNNLESSVNSDYHNNCYVDLNDPLPIRIAKFWSGIYEDEAAIKKKIREAENNALQKELLSKVNTAEVIWESEPKPTKASKTTDILQAAYSDEVLRLTPLIIEAHTKGDSIKENQHLDELEKLMILHGKLKN